MPNSTFDQSALHCDPDSVGPSVVDFLCSSTAYPDQHSAVEVIETHISWVFLTGNFVYKLKKPVQFEFVDFHRVEQRHAACINEMTLNRRLAPDVYLDVLPITADEQGNLHLGGDGPAIDWVVKMKRLPAESSLDQLIENKQLTEHDVTALGTTLTDFYRQLTPPEVELKEYVARLEHHIIANFEDLAKPQFCLDSWRLKRLQTAQRRYVSLSHQLLAARIHDGRIVDGHGDLRPEHIYFAPTPKLIDCLEFSQELRTIDVVDELAFLTMECDKLGADLVGRKVLQTYCTTTGDRVPPALIEFFMSYRACVRAKVNALRSQQVAESASREFIKTAEDYLRLAVDCGDRLGIPVMLVVRGLSGTGKSTVAAAVANAFGCPWLGTDALRRQLFGASATESGFDDARYTPDNRRQVYEEMFRIAAEHLSHRVSVVLDGTFVTADLRQRTLSLAQTHQVAALLVECRCPKNVARQRIRERQNQPDVTSDARPELVDRQHSEEEPNHPAWPVCTVDTTATIDQIGKTIFECVRRLIFPANTANEKSVAEDSVRRDD